MRLATGFRLGPYEIVAPLGSGGMGEVYRARDNRLERDVAIKVLGETVVSSPETLSRFRREAMLLAAITHPNVCQIFDLGEHQGTPYLAMELLAGESLSTRLEATRTLTPAAAVAVAKGVLAALGELHARGIIHRDLKPSNIFLTPHGTKLLDFGVARQVSGVDNDHRLTRTGSVFGTPRYMAPEQWNGDADPRSDIFACGAVLYEMLSGKPAFPGSTAVEVLRPVLAGELAPLGGGENAALEWTIRRALSPGPDDRFASAAEMATALDDAFTGAHSATLTMTVHRPVSRSSGRRPATRLLVLPFRLLRPDPEIDFLSTALADAVTSSLAGLSHLVVRSSRMLRAAEDDLGRLAAESGVDALLYGTLLRAGERVRVATQLVEAPGGRVMHSSTAEASLRDLFELQDDLARQVVAALRLPLETGEERVHEAAPHPEAYELYLRALGTPLSGARASALVQARALLARAVELDPNFAPAWAQLGRMHRLLAKYGHADRTENVEAARRAFETALALDPGASTVHNLYTHFEIEEMASPVPAMLRLLGQLDSRPGDAALYAGLVTACRYTGLLEASLAAHERARELDPEIRTGVHYTYWMMGDWARAAEFDNEPLPFARHYALPMLGRTDEAIRGYESWRANSRSGLEVDLAEAMVAALRGDNEHCLACADRMLGSGFRDAEGVYFLARCIAFVGGRERALALLEQVVSQGFTCWSILARDPWLDSLREEPRFQALVARAKNSREHARALFLRARGAQLLDLSRETLAALRDPES